ncbi:UDP-N-acetylglucosamine 1-carboxyvinyltransferase [Paramuricea clavata]|uniref:UDP-N-acetylglucosamine 1-carboxyvinyltransferase n=1 Tax=Paramuricea clavata TaxID=317549 RepID=A0A7D9I858_PARCT|nr:UDP-N-acetylglucosamine 1-carboxyvinyltransferase [Paramuricea clavata]
MTSNEIMISGASPCSGSIQISGAKNATLPLMAACLLTDKQVVLENVPKISDIDKMKTQLESYGVKVIERGSRRVLQATSVKTEFSPTSSDDSNTRGSFLVLGPLLARLKAAKVRHPGGCQISKGGRPVNYHIEALREMGATLESDRKCIKLKANLGLHGTKIDSKMSVGTTENVIMAACLADGQTVITNAAVEPEIIDLIKMLNAMGMNGNIGVNEHENKIVINGRSGTLLNGCTHTVIPDRIEAGTWAIAAAITGGSLLLKMNSDIGQRIMVPTLEMLKKAGVDVEWKRNGLQVQRLGQIKPVSITTGPFPKFPTDLLPQWVTFMTKANGSSRLKDTIYDNRFSHVPHLETMGASFTKLSDTEYQVDGNANLRGNRVEATDLRAGVALILAGLAAEGTTVVRQFQHVLRGYEDIKEKLGCWGVQFQNLPQTRQGFHGGNRRQVRQEGPVQHDRKRR